jgi:phospholipase C
VTRSRTAAAAVVLAILSACTFGTVMPTRTAKPIRAASGPIKHVVVIYQENHSFDNVLGLYCAQVAAGNIHRAGVAAACDGVAGAPTVPGSLAISAMPDVVPSIAHRVSSQRSAIDAGKMDGWLHIGGCKTGACLGQVLPNQSVNVTTLANGFVIADRTFENSTSPSWVGHIELVAGTKDGFFGDNPVYQPGPGVPPQGRGWGCDSNQVASYGETRPIVFVPSCIPDNSLPIAQFPFGGAFRSTPAKQVPTIMDKIQAAGLTWKLYAGDGPTTTAVHGWEICPTFAKCLYTKQVRHWFRNTRVMADARNGKLPSFSVVTPTSSESQHNGDSWAAGDDWIGRVVSAIENGPDWNSTAIFITWDDCGCFYDHVNPLKFGATWGVRVPMLIVSPYARAGYTDSGPTTFSGVLAFTEKTFGLSSLGTSDIGAYDFANSFDYSQAPLHGVAMVRDVVPLASALWIKSHPPSPDDPT